MKYRISAFFLLIITAILIACCMQQAPPAPVAIPSPTVPVTETIATVVPQPSFSLGDQYLSNQYKFNTPTDVYSEQFMVDNSSWAIKFAVSPKSDNLEKCWFQLNVTDMNKGLIGTYGYGKNYSYEKDQLIPLYKTGSYKIDMKGNLVTVDIIAAKRNP
jgi:hypothetical protein